MIKTPVTLLPYLISSPACFQW